MKSLLTVFCAAFLLATTVENAYAQCNTGSAYCWPNVSSAKQGESFGNTLYYYTNYAFPDATFYVGLTSDNGATWAMLQKVDIRDKKNYDSYYYEVDYKSSNYTYIYGYNYTLTVPNTVPAGSYLIALLESPNTKGGCAIANSYGTELTIIRGCNKPVLKSKVPDVVACAGSAVTVKVDGPYEKGNIWYDWYKDGNKINTSFEPIFSFPDIKPSDGGSYYAIINDICNLTTTTNTFKVSVSQPGVITTEPAGKTVCQGNAYTMKVIASGTPLTYQWYKNGVALLGKTTDSYTISSANSADEGTYTVIVKGGCGDPDTSAKATIAVPSKPVFTTPLQGGFFCPGTTAVIAPDVTGTILAYQWYKNDQPIPGANARNLTLTPMSIKDNGTYWVEVSVPGSELSGCPAITKSARVYVGAYEAPVIKKQPASADVCAGSKAKLVVEAEGTGLTYQWSRNGSPLPNSNNYSLEIPNINAAQGGEYTVQVTGACGFFSVSEVATINVFSAPAISVQPEPVRVTEGETIVLSVQATEVQNVVWTLNEKEIANGPSTMLSIPNAKLSDGGYYRALVQNVCGGTTSKSVRVTVIDPKSLDPRLASNTTTLNIGDVPYGYSSDFSFEEVITNIGNVPVTITGSNVSGADASAFTVVLSTAPTVLQPGESMTAMITFKPTRVGAASASLTITSDAVNGPHSFDLRGTGVIRYTVNGDLAFGVVDRSSTTTKCFQINNNSTVDITIDQVSLAGANAGTFTVSTPTPLSVAAGSTTELCLQFTPTEVGNYSASVGFKSATGGNLDASTSGTAQVAASVTDATSAGVIAYPNPASQSISISTGSVTPTEVAVVSVSGQLIATLPATTHLSWNLVANDGSKVPTGTYVLLITDKHSTYRMMLQVVR